MEVQAELIECMDESRIRPSAESSIEQALSRHAAVLEAVVVSPPASFDRPALTVFITLKDGATQSQPLLDDFAELAQSASGRADVAIAILLVPALPKTRSGKIRRQLLVNVDSP